jgi:hypothetical protein
VSFPSAAECSFFKITPTKHMVLETKTCSESMFEESQKKTQQLLYRETP